MADKTVEQLSALVDGEFEELELELALRRLAKDKELKARWQRYHLISDALKNNLPEVIDMKFADRVSKAIDSEPALKTKTTTPISPVSSWYKPIVGFGLAASVATVALLGMNMLQPDESPTTSSLSAVASSVPVTNVQTSAADQANTAGGRLDSRLNSYLVNHNEYASMNRVHGMLPYVRMVGYQTNP